MFLDVIVRPWPSRLRRAGAGLIAVVVLLAAGWSEALAGEADLFAPRFEWRQWKPEQGLPDSAVESVYQARDGWIWIGTRKGLARFDGVQFTSVSGAGPGVGEEAVLTMGEDDAGALWIGTKRGPLVLEPQGLVRPAETNAVFGSGVRALVPAREPGLWMVTARAVSRLRSGRWEHRSFVLPEAFAWPQPEPPQLFALAEDAAGMLWIGSDAGLYRLDWAGGIWTRVWAEPVPQGSAGGEHHIVRTVLADAAGRLWFATDRLLCERRADGSVVTYPIPRGSADPRARRLHATAEGVELVAGGRLYRVRPARLEAVTFWPGQEDAFVADSLVDREGTRWLGTRFGGVVQLRQPRVTVFTTRDGLPHNNVFSVAPAGSGGLWIATGGGLAELREGRFETVTVPGFEPTQAWHVVREDSAGDLWLGANPAGIRWLTNPTNNPLASAPAGTRFVPGYLEGRPEVFDVFPIRGGVARTVYEDREGRIWVGRQDGLSAASAGVKSIRFTSGPWAGRTFASRRPYRWYFGAGGRCETDWAVFLQGKVSERFPGVQVIEVGEGARRSGEAGHEFDPPIPWDAQPSYAEVRAVLEDRAGRMWFATSLGLSCVERGVTRIYNRADGLAGDAVEALFEDADGGVWAGTRSGLSRYREGSWLTFPSTCGLEETEFRQIVEDAAGHLWFGGQRGLTRVRRGELEAVASGRATRVNALTLGEADGMLNGETMGGAQPSVARTADGRLWFATGQGLAMVDPAAVPAEGAEPAPFVECLVVAGERIEARRASVAEPAGMQTRALELAPGSGRSLEVHYTALHYAAPERLRFEYALTGYDRQPVKAGTRRVAYFTNLRPGDYRFRVRAFDRDGQGGGHWAELPFRVRPFVWETWWFRAAIAAMLAVSLVGWVRWRLQERQRFARIEQENQLREERERIARDLHDDVAANLTLITMLKPPAVTGPAEPGVRDFHRRAAALADAALDQLAEVVWATNPRFDTLDSLAAYLREMTHRLLAGSGVQPEFAFPEAIPSQPVSGEFRRHCVLIVKEAVHNVLKHARAGRLTLEFRVEGTPANRLTLVIADDGAGLPAELLTPAKLSSRPGNGLPNLRARVERMGGMLRLENLAPRGARVTVAVAFPNPGIR